MVKCRRYGWIHLSLLFVAVLSKQARFTGCGDLGSSNGNKWLPILKITSNVIFMITVVRNPSVNFGSHGTIAALNLGLTQKIPNTAHLVKSRSVSRDKDEIAN